MKKVEFVRLKSELCGYGFGKGSKYGFDGVEAVIKNELRADGITADMFPLKHEERVTSS